MKTSAITLIVTAVLIFCVACDDAIWTVPTPTPVPTKTPAEVDMDIVISFLETSQADRSRFLIERGSDGRVIGLDLTARRMIGDIPPQLGRLTELKFLRLGYNGLTGEIPPELGKLTNLVELQLFDNQLSGEIPSELGNLHNLQELHLFGNNLSGRYHLRSET